MSTLEARIAEVLGAHQWYDAAIDYEYPATGCTGCDDWFGDENAVDDGTFGKHQVAMLAPVIREREAEAWDKGHADGWQSRQDDWAAGFVPSGYTQDDTNPYRSNDE